MDVDAKQEAIHNAIKQKREVDQRVQEVLKSCYTGHATRKTKQMIEIDFLNVNNIREAFNKWFQVMETLKSIDPNIVIHHYDNISKDIIQKTKSQKLERQNPMPI